MPTNLILNRHSGSCTGPKHGTSPAASSWAQYIPHHAQPHDDPHTGIINCIIIHTGKATRTCSVHTDIPPLLCGSSKKVNTRVQLQQEGQHAQLPCCKRASFPHSPMSISPFSCLTLHLIEPVFSLPAIAAFTFYLNAERQSAELTILQGC